MTFLSTNLLKYTYHSEHRERRMSRLAHAAQNVQTEYQPQTGKERERRAVHPDRQKY